MFKRRPIAFKIKSTWPSSSVFPLNAYERQRGEYELEMVCERMVCNFVHNKLLNDINMCLPFFRSNN